MSYVKRRSHDYDRIDVWRLFRSRGDLLHGDCETVGSGAWRYDEREKRRDGDAMRKRNHVIPVRLNARELRELEEQVEKSGLSREEFMRSLILGAQVHAKPCEHHPELLRKIAGLCNNANQLAHVANASGMASEQSVQEMLRLTKETWHLVKEEW